MKKTCKAVALLLGSLFALSAFAACTDKGGEAGDYRICYDNLGGGYLDESVTKVEAKGAKIVAAYDAAGVKVSDASSIATYADGVFTAVSSGTVVYEAGGEQGTVEVVPAYVTDPGYQYTGRNTDFSEIDGESVLGNTHDPSLIETQGSDGRPVYYIFSTGWADKSEAVMGSMRGATTYGNAIHVSYDGMKTWMFLGRTFDYETRNDDFVRVRSGEWLYNEGGTSEETGTPTAASGDAAYSSDSAGWWAPDIVKNPTAADIGCTPVWWTAREIIPASVFPMTTVTMRVPASCCMSRIRLMRVRSSL